MNFQDLLGPISEPLFFERYFEREVLHIEREDTAAFVKLSDSIDIEQIIHLSCHNWGEVSLAKAGAGPALDDYTSHPPTVSIIDRAYRDGYTVVINDLQKRSLTVAQLCRSVEARFFCRANVNLYRTAAGCAGLDCHYDDDDVIVIQLRGHKVWQTYQHRDRLPLGESSYHLSDIGQADRRLSMRAGDVLYMPHPSRYISRSRSISCAGPTCCANSSSMWPRMTCGCVARSRQRCCVRMHPGLALRWWTGSELRSIAAMPRARSSGRRNGC
jgi:ribosomal protein L16 Arg81 hydroxylase